MSNPYQAPKAEELLAEEPAFRERVSYRREKNRQLLWMLGLFAVAGVLEGLVLSQPDLGMILNVAASLAFCILILNWCHYDRLELGRRRWRYFAPMMVLLPGPLVMVPLYLVVSRGARGLWSTFLAACFLALLFAVNLLGIVLVLRRLPFN